MSLTRTATDSIGTKAGSHPADLVETGNLLRTQPGALPEKSATESGQTANRHHNVVVIGAGQAGLSVGYHLNRWGIDHVIVDGASCIGDVWRNRWDSLRLFTPAKFDGLDGYRFPASKDTFPTKDQMADYLESYARKFDLPVRLNSRVERLHRSDDHFVLETTGGSYEADRVVVAAASYQKPRVPPLARDVGADLFQIRSHEYRKADQIPEGSVLVIGAGNSGAEIALELSRTHNVCLSGRNVGHVPFDIEGFLGRKLLVRLVIRGLFHRVLTMRTPWGRKFRSKMHGHGMPLIRTRPGQLARAGVRRIGKIAGFADGKAVSEDGEQVTCKSIVWCTGFDPGFDWIDLPVLDDQGMPRHRFGKSADLDGLYFVGLPFQYSVSSTVVSGVGRDALRVARWVAAGA